MTILLLLLNIVKQLFLQTERISKRNQYKRDDNERWRDERI